MYIIHIPIFYIIHCFKTCITYIHQVQIRCIMYIYLQTKTKQFIFCLKNSKQKILDNILKYGRSFEIEENRKNIRSNKESNQHYDVVARHLPTQLFTFLSFSSGANNVNYHAKRSKFHLYHAIHK